MRDEQEWDFWEMGAPSKEGKRSPFALTRKQPSQSLGARLKRQAQEGETAALGAIEKAERSIQRGAVGSPNREQAFKQTQEMLEACLIPQVWRNSERHPREERLGQAISGRAGAIARGWIRGALMQTGDAAMGVAEALSHHESLLWAWAAAKDVEEELPQSQLARAWAKMMPSQALVEPSMGLALLDLMEKSKEAREAARQELGEVDWMSQAIEAYARRFGAFHQSASEKSSSQELGWMRLRDGAGEELKRNLKKMVQKAQDMGALNPKFKKEWLSQAIEVIEGFVGKGKEEAIREMERELLDLESQSVRAKKEGAAQEGRAKRI